MVSKKADRDTHISLMIGCTKEGLHAAFHIEPGKDVKIVCDHCGHNFIDEIEAVHEITGRMLEGKPLEDGDLLEDDE